MVHKQILSTKRIAYAIIPAILLVLTLTSCELKKAVNEFNDHCPITLVEGVTIKEASTNKSGDVTTLTIQVSIDTQGVDVPASTSEIWTEVVSDIKSLMRSNVAASDLLNAAESEKALLWFNIYDLSSGRLLYSGAGFTPKVRTMPNY